MTITWLVHNRVRLALHEVSNGSGRPLLVLHGLGECTPSSPKSWLDPWPGPVFGLDFTGHGASTIPRGGGYTAEILMADADAAIAHLGKVTVLGRGLGAYIALLIAGARPAEVRGAVLADGPGLVGGGVRPGTSYVGPIALAAGGPPDPFALLELAMDVRPPDYAQEYVRQVMQGSGLEQPLVVAAVTRPEWLEAVAAEPGVVEAPVAAGLSYFSGVE